MRYLLVLLICLAAFPAVAAQRLALVVGINAYTDVEPLKKAVNDAGAVADALEAQGFTVITSLDATRRELNRQIARFTGQLRPGDTAFVFFAGHGVEIAGENYLLPADIVTPSAGEQDFVAAESIALSSLLDRVRRTGARTTIAVIDACRDNPFARRGSRAIGGTRGLARITAPEGTFVIFSAGAGQLALDRLSNDDANPNSVFTRALLPRLSQPGLELRALVADLRTEVRDLALTIGHSQFPAYYDELLGDFFLAGAQASAPVVAAAPSGPESDRGLNLAPETPAALAEQIRADFELARELRSAAALRAFIARYEDRSDDLTLAIARELLAEMDAPAAEPQQQAALPTPPPEPEQTPTETATRALIRATQEELNRLGCEAGGADGIVGPRTRRAFRTYLAETGSDFAAGDLGKLEPLVDMRGRQNRVCPAPVVAAPAPTPPAADQPAPAPQPQGPSLAGTWSSRWTCNVIFTGTGTYALRSSPDGAFSGSYRDSLNQVAQISGRLSGRSITATARFTTVGTQTFSATLAPDGNSFRGQSSNGCVFTATKIG